ncbi:hypothetical protein Bca101_067778 [Brassica carinata]
MTVQEWHDALDVSTSYATEDEVRPILKYSCDNLKDSCFLLMEDDDNDNKFVKMHDLVREMALWLPRLPSYQ